MDYIILSKTFIILMFILVMLDAYRKVQVWREFEKNYKTIIEKFSIIQIMVNSKESEGKIILNEYTLKYKTKEELLIKFEMFISSTINLYEEIKAYSFFIEKLKDKNNELYEIKYKIKIQLWKIK